MTQADSETAELDDDQLAAMAQQNPEDFALIYRRYLDPVYRYCRRRLGDQEAAEDAASLVFANALAALPRYRSGSFRAWLFTIAHNVIVSDIRQRRAHDSIDDVGELADRSEGPEAIVLAAEARGGTQALLAQLTPQQRRVLELRLSGLSGREIAEVLGMSHAAVKVAQFRAIARLRTLVAPARSPGSEHDAS